MSKTPDGALVEEAEAGEPTPNRTTSSGEHAKVDAVRCAHCPEAHPSTYSHCPRTGRPLQTGPALVGRVIAGRYRVTGILGEGGMGAVYIAEHLMLGRKVAIKRLHPELTGDEKAVARFQREARAAAATGHEHIVEVLDLGYAEDGAPYLVMEHLRGSALAQVLKQEGRLGLARTANIVGQVLAALAAVHQREIVHRDLKPDNIFLTRRGGVADYVKVLDFGISKMKHEDGEPTNLTRTGVTMGTPYYMSPEQARGVRKLDHRVDLYAVAVIAYECLTGRLPLMGDNYHALLQQILRVDPLPPSMVVPGLPTELDAVILRGLAKDPAQRYASASEMLDALAPFGARVGDVAGMLATQPVSGARTDATAERGGDGRVDARAPTEAVSAPQGAATPLGASHPGAKQTGAVKRPEPVRAAATPAAASGANAAPANAGSPTAAPTPASAPAPGGPGPASAAGSAPGMLAPHVARPSTPAPTTRAATSAPARSVSPRAQPPTTATGPRYFFAASDDWSGAHERLTRSAGGGQAAGSGTGPASSASMGATPASPATGPSPAGALGLGQGALAAGGTAAGPSSAERALPPLETTLPGVREAAATRPARDELSVKGALVAGLLDHLDAELGSAGAALTLSAVDPTLRAKLDGVILPMAWLPLTLFDALLEAVDRSGTDASRASAAGRAAAERELSTTHRLFLQTASPATVLDRLPHLHRVYFSRGEAKVSPSASGARVDVDGMGHEGPAFVAWLSGFWQRMLELAGARDVKVTATTCQARGDDRTSVTLRWR